MPLVHAIWEFFDAEAGHTWLKGRAKCKMCETKIYGSCHTHKRDMAAHLKKEHPERFAKYNQLKHKKEALKGHHTIGETIGAILEKEKFRQALLDLKGSLRTEVINPIKPIAEPSNIPCSICGKVFKKIHKLERHTRFSHGFYNNCGYKFIQPKNIKEHQNEHITEFNCTMCAKRYKYASSLIIHTSNVHEGKTFDCDICDFKTAQKVNLDGHVRRVHLFARLNCKNCDRFFSSVQVLKAHIAKKTRWQESSLQFLRL